MADRVARLLDLLFPPRCVACQAPGALWCDSCRAAVPDLPEPRCARCDTPLRASRSVRCADCERALAQPQPPALERIVVARPYDGSLASAIRALKFRRQRRLAAPLSALLLEAVERAGVSVDVVVPMPLHAERKRQRGFNQAALLARPLARQLRAPLCDDLLKRVRATEPQTRLSVDRRRANVEGAFMLAAGASAALVGKRVALVDDVTTTGATLDAAASALLLARPAAIYGLAVARPLFLPGSASARD